MFAASRSLPADRTILGILSRPQASVSFRRGITCSVGCKYASIRTWRAKHGLPPETNAYGPLADNPDWTYEDGRPCPMGKGQMRRYEMQKEYAKKIIQLTKEVDFAVERHKKMKMEEEARKQSIIEGKLRPKGKALLEDGTKDKDD